MRHDTITAKSQSGHDSTIGVGDHVAVTGILRTMRIRWGLVAAVLTCTVLLTVYKDETTRAQALPSHLAGADFSDATVGAKEDSAARTLAPGHFRFTTGLDQEPQHIQGPVTCDTRDDVYRIAIGDLNAGGVEIGLSQDESILKYADLGYRNGANLMLINDGDADREPGKARPILRKLGNTYFASGYATGLTASQRETDRYFEISVACP